MKSWELWGSFRGEWRLLDEHAGTVTLSDGFCHEFVIGGCDRFLVEAVRLCQTGRNRTGSSQMHLSSFILSGDVVFPRGAFGMNRRVADWEFGLQAHPETGAEANPAPVSEKSTPFKAVTEKGKSEPTDLSTDGVPVNQKTDNLHSDSGLQDDGEWILDWNSEGREVSVRPQVSPDVGEQRIDNPFEDSLPDKSNELAANVGDTQFAETHIAQPEAQSQSDSVGHPEASRTSEAASAESATLIDSIETPSDGDATVDKVSSQSADHSDTFGIAVVRSDTKTEPLPYVIPDVIKEEPVPKNEDQSRTQCIETPMDRIVETSVLSDESPPVPDNRAILDENLLFPDQTAGTAGQRSTLITEMADLRKCGKSVRAASMWFVWSGVRKPEVVLKSLLQGFTTWVTIRREQSVSMTACEVS
jgi:hypothetical protein